MKYRVIQSLLYYGWVTIFSFRGLWRVYMERRYPSVDANPVAAYADGGFEDGCKASYPPRRRLHANSCNHRNFLRLPEKVHSLDPDYPNYRSTVIHSLCILVIVIVCILLTCSLASAESYSGRSISNERRQMTAVGKSHLLVAAHRFPGFQKTIIYQVNGRNIREIQSISKGYGAIVYSNKTSCIVEIEILPIPKAYYNTTQTFFQINTNNMSLETIIRYAQTYDFDSSLIDNKYIVFGGKLYFLDSGVLLYFGDLQFYGPPKKKTILSSIERCEQYDTALLLYDENGWKVFDGTRIIDLPGLDKKNSSGDLNLIILEEQLLFAYDSQMFCYTVQQNKVVEIKEIFPNKNAKLQSSLYYQDGFVFSIWGECLYSYSISTRQWERLFQFNQNDIKGYTLNESEIAICDNCLYLVLQTQKTTTKADLFFCDLRNLDEQDETLSVKRLMRVRKTAFFE